MPDWRSLTTPRLVMIVPMNTSTTPARPGIITSDVLSVGLYRIVTCGLIAVAAANGQVQLGQGRERRLRGEELTAVDQDLGPRDTAEGGRAAARDDRGGGVAVPELILRPRPPAPGVCPAGALVLTTWNGAGSTLATSGCVGTRHGDRDRRDVEAGRVAEHHEQDDRHRDHHGQRPPVPPKLPELLHDHGPHVAVLRGAGTDFNVG